MKALACGDFHLGAGTASIGDFRLQDQEQVWQQIVDLALEEHVDAVLIAGDVWEKRHPSPAELMAFARPLARLYERPIPILAIPGNHCVSHPDLPIALDLFDYAIDVHRTPGLWSVGDVTVATLPWAPVSRLVAQAGGGDRDDLHQIAAEYLLSTSRGLRSEITGPAVLLAHWSVSGASLPSGIPIDLAREVILSLADLEAIGFDAIVLAHIHRQQVLSEDPFIAYVGSPLPLTFGEPGEHGCLLLELAA